ncbi:MAG: tetratricopeptide repeat protein [Planctomycetota bacterium]|jgi:tetratricopeptide (TPR) repeat protein
MKHFHWLLLLIAVGSVAGLVRLVRTNVALGPEDYLERGRSMLASEDPDTEGARREFDRALALNRESGGGRALEAAVLYERGTMYEKRGMLPSARADFSALAEWVDDLPEEERPALASGAPANRNALLLRLAGLELGAKEYEASEDWANQVLELQPEHSWALTLRGRSFVFRAEQAFAFVEEFIDAGLHDALADVARRLALLAVHAPVSESERYARVEEFLSLFDERHKDESSEVIEQLDLASEYMAEARTAFAESFRRSAAPTALFEITRSYLKAEHPELVLDVGLAAIRHEEAAANTRAMQVISQALLRVGRPDAAMRIVEQAVPIEGTLELDDTFLPTWAQILHANESWARLRRVGEQMGRRFANGLIYQPERDSAAFYQGIAAYNMGLINAAQEQLAGYVRDDAFEPFPGAKAEARAAMASIVGGKGNAAGELYHLRRSLLPNVVQPPGRGKPELAQAWTRLAQLFEEGDYQGPVVQDAYAHALRFSREPDPEQLARWRELGEEHLARIGRDPRILASSLERQGRWVRTEAEEPYEDFRLAEVWLERGELAGVLDAARRFLKRYPHFGPAEELMQEAYRRSYRPQELADLLLGRLREDLASIENFRELRRLEAAGDLSPDQVFELMAADAQVTGSLAMAEQLIPRGRADLAVRALEAAPTEDLGSEGAVLLARAEIELGRFDEALAHVEAVPLEDPRFTQALDLRVEAALQSRDKAALQRVLDQLVEVQNFELEAALGVVDRLLANRTADSALALLRRLDELPEGRGAEVLSRLTVAELMGGDLDAAAEALARAEAYREDGFAQLGRVLLAVEARSWSRLPALVRELRDAELSLAGDAGLDPLREAVLAALEERLSEAVGRAQEGLATQPEEPLWGLVLGAIEGLLGRPINAPGALGREGQRQTALFLVGAPQAPRDPRQCLAALVTFGYPEWELWGRAQLLEQESESSGVLWPGYLTARLEQRAGSLEVARNRLRPLSKRFSDCVPVWQLLEDVAFGIHGRLEHPELLAYRAGRAAAAGAASSEAGVMDLLVLAETLERNGELGKALARAREAVELDPQSTLAHLRDAQLCVRQQLWSEAIENYAFLFEFAEPELTQGYLPEFISAVDHGLAADAIDLDSVTLLLESLATRLPTEPLLAARLAELEFDRLPDNPLLAGSRAVAYLERFRERTEDVALEDLREGVTESWLDLYLAYDRALAESFIRSELGKRPENLELWLMYGRTLEASGRYEEAVEHYETVRRMVPEPRALRRAADILARLGTDHPRVVSYAQRIAAVDGLQTNDPQLRFLLARSRVNGSPTGLDAGVADLVQLWNDRERLPESILDELPTLLLAAILRRGHSADKDLAIEVGEIALAQTKGDLEQEAIRAQLNLALLLPRLPGPDAPPPDEPASQGNGAPGGSGS